MFNVYIGYDSREDIAAQVCRYSIIERMSIYRPVMLLRRSQLQCYERNVPNDPQSTEFTYTRFLLPHLNRFQGYSIFVDCDFLFLDDINNLFESVDPTAAVSVVKHPRYIPLSQIKMDGIEQHAMHRKNWASLIVFNNSHPSNKKLTPQYINTVVPGRSLHEFGWLRDKEIGSISLDWNTLDGYYELDNPRAIHYTEGGPWFEKYKNTYYSEYWWNEYYSYTNACGQPQHLSPDPR